MKIWYIDDVIDELKEKKYCDELEILCNGSPIERIETGNKCNLNIVSLYRDEDGLEDQVSDLEDDLSDLECENGSLKDDLNRIRDAFEDEELESNIEDFFETHPEEKEILSKLSIEKLVGFIKSVVDWYNIEKDIR